MFAHKHYVPLMKSRDGDFWSLEHLKAASRPSITPLIELVPPSAKQTEEARIASTVRKMTKVWGRDFFADLIWRENVLLHGGKHVVTEFFDQARAGKLTPIPVTGLARSPAHQIAIRDVVATDKRGLMIRLVADDFANAATLKLALDRILGFVGIAAKDTHVLIDYKSVVPLAVGVISGMSLNSIAMLPYVNDWKTLTVGAGAFPASVSHLPQANWTILDRKEWQSWRGLVTAVPLALARQPSYADYGVRDPDLPYTGFARYSVNLRYSADTYFFVWRGYPASKHPLGNGQMHGICADLISRPQYATAAFSQGDSEIQVRATTTGSPGGPNTWLQWATNHYLELVVSQIASLP